MPRFMVYCGPRTVLYGIRKAYLNMPSLVRHDAKATNSSPTDIKNFSHIPKWEIPKGWNTTKNSVPMIALMNFSFIILIFLSAH